MGATGDFFAAFLFAGIQVLLLKTVFYFIKTEKRQISVIVIIAKFALYIVGITVLYKHYTPHIFRCAVGFVAGLPLTALIIFLIPPVTGKIISAVLDRKADSVRRSRRKNGYR